MAKIFLTSDLHFCHDRPFIWGCRGFESITQMNEQIIERYNSIVSNEDTVYILGDLVLSDIEAGIKYVQRLNGQIHLILGNHDGTKKQKYYKEFCPNIISMSYAEMIKYKKYHFYLSHYPTFVGNYDDKTPKQMILNLYGHTHQETNFFENNFQMYHVGVDSHSCYPIEIESIIDEIKTKYQEKTSEL